MSRPESRHRPRARRAVALCLTAATLLLTGACSGGSKKMVLELRGAVVYEKPQIVSVAHVVEDLRGEGGAFVVRVTLTGDPGLEATFDVTPDVAELQPMVESEAGVYVGEYGFPEGRIGGPFTILGRLRHADAGESVLRDQESLLVTLPPRR
ncbi:MAG: hypothetical protein GY716_12120 [bacterium]|nr:hypothetical protein [bacterium]